MHMRYLLWLLKLALFLVIFGFALKNTDSVLLRFYLGYEWNAPLVFILLIFFCAGVAGGILATLGHIFRQRREIASLKRELRVANQEASRRLPVVLDDGA